MAKRSALRIDRWKRSHQLDQDETRIPINRETAEIIAQQKKLFREQFGREPGTDDPLFFEPGVAVPQFLSDESTDEIWKSLLQAAGDSGIEPVPSALCNVTHGLRHKFIAHAVYREKV
jgi:integrase